MAMQIETPSRIWRRIKEAEARDDDMPSLPSLPGLDDSSLSDLDPCSSFDNDVAAKTKPSLDTVQSSPVPLPPTRGRLSGKEPSGPSDFSIRQDVEKENDGHAQHPSSHTFLGVTESTRANHVSNPKKEIADAGYSHVTLVAQQPIVARHPASDGRSSTTLAQPRNALKFVDTNLLPTDMSQALQASSNDYSLSDVPKLHEFEDITVRKPSRTNRQPYTVASLPSSSLSIPSLPSISVTRSSVWAEEDNEATERGLETVTIQPPVGAESERLRRDYIDGSSGAETVKIIEAEISRDPTFSSEDAEATRRIAVQYPKFVALPAGLTTPAQVVQAKSGIRGYAPLEENHDEADDLTTPLPRRKSFLLSVVNSTVRPRMTAPSPHSRAHLHKVVACGAAVTPGPSRLLNTRARRVRLSHPLAQVSELPLSPPSDAVEENDDKLEGANGSSFVSTASSHDLTLYHRANASFDPLTGPQGVSRFNAGKLNSYLHGLNRRLQEENEILVHKIRSQQAELEIFHDQTRRRELSGVVEDQAAEQWILEKEALEQRVAEFEKRIEAKDEELAESQAQRMRDRERWKERMKEVEDGVGNIIADLERRVEEAETRAALLNVVEEQLRDVQAELDGIKAEDRRCKDTSKSTVGGGLEDVMRKLEEKENELSRVRGSLAEREKETSTLQNIIHDLEYNLRATRGSIGSSQEDARELRKEQRELKDELRDSQATIDKLKSESSCAIDKVKELERRLAETRESLVEKGEAVELANERASVASEELEKARASIQQLEAALEESDKKILADGNELIALRSKLSVTKRESEPARTDDPMKGEISDGRADLNALEAELANARKEIGRLNSLIDQNPARRALDKARESRIDLLEKENQELLEQLRAVREPTFLATPLRNATMSGISPMHRRLLNLTLRTPRTPGEPLKNASWLMNATGEITTNHLVDEIDRLQRELDLANESIDDKLDKLEEAGLGVVGLTKALDDARQRITDLERQLEESEMRIPRGDLCAHCGSGENDRATRLDPNSTLQLRLAMITAELEALRKQRDEELVSSSGEKAVLRDATNRLNFEIKRAKEELRVAKEKGHKAEKSKAELQQELASARKTIDDLEHFLQSERSRLCTVGIENSNATKEKDRIMEKLKETEQKMEMTKDRLFKLKEANIGLESELKAERKTAHIEETLIGNRETIDRLRQERSQLSEKYYDLQQLLAEASKNASSLATMHAKLQSTYDSHRRQLDRQAEEIEKLRAALSSQRQTQDVGWLNKNVHADDEELKALALRLQSELSRIQEEANKFGRDLIYLKAERDQLVNRHHEELEQHERETKQIRTQLRCLKQQVASRKESKDLATEIQNATEALRLRHNRECKGLFVQIRYLKAKFTREAALRDDLGYQKSYLLVLLSRYEKSEKILATIAAIGPIPTVTRPVQRQSLKKAALAILFINRARRASEIWRAQRSACAAVSAALDNVRKNRAWKA